MKFSLLIFSYLINNRTFAVNKRTFIDIFSLKNMRINFSNQ